MKVSTGGTGGDFPILDEGGYISRVCSIIDIGIHDTNFGEKHQVIITWELPTELGEDGRPYVMSKFETLSLHEKANLRKMIESMKGKIPAEKLEDPEFIDNLFVKILGTPAQLSVSQYKNKEGYLRNGIEGIGKPMKGIEVPPAINEPLILDLEHFDRAVYDKLPEWQQKKVDEGKAKFDAQNVTDTDDDNIPFNEDNPATADEADW